MNYTDLQIAHVCHEATRAMQALHGDECPSPPWEQAEPEHIESSVASVKAIRAGATPEDLQADWAVRKLADGWTYGPRKDHAAKTHPCLVPFAELPPSQQFKDRVYHAIVHALAGQEG